MAVSAGLDVHKKKCHGVIFNENGEVLKDEEFEIEREIIEQLVMAESEYLKVLREIGGSFFIKFPDRCLGREKTGPSERLFCLA